MKKLLIYIAMAGATLLTSSCNDWLDVLPKNEQVSPEYWKTKSRWRGTSTRISKHASDGSYINLLGRTSRGSPFMLIQVNRNRNYRIFS